MNIKSVIVFVSVFLVFAGHVLAGTPSSCPLDEQAAFSRAIHNESPVAAFRNFDIPERRYYLGEVIPRFEKYIQTRLGVGDEKTNALLFYISDGNEVCLFLFEAMAGNDRLQRSSFHLSSDAKEFASDVQTQLDQLIAAGRIASERSPVRRTELGRTNSDRGATALKATHGDQRSVSSIFQGLSELLVPGSLAERIESYGSMSVIPALNVGLVPFAALDPNGDGQPLVNSVAVNIEASAYSVYEQKLYGWSPGVEDIKSAAVFGDPNATNDPEWLFPRLPGAAHEAREVARLLHTEAVIGNEVTRKVVLEKLLEAEFVHIAAHGISDTSNPMEDSFLALSDGRLVGIDIENLRLPTGQIVVLSACQSGLGHALDGGVAGLSRAFIYGGSMLVVSSLWNVDDSATQWIMTRFVELLEQTNPIEALRRSQNEARVKWDDPLVWSAFVSFGSRIVTAE